MTKKVIVEVPHRISGFFEIIDTIDNVKIQSPERIGSKGAGFNLNAVGKTEIIVKKLNKYEDPRISIFINNEKLNQNAETTYYIYNFFQSQFKIPLKIKIRHIFELPVGCGYGASGSGALGAVYGLNSLLNLNLSNNELGKIAHIAEVMNRTGLGTVCGQLAGGLSILQEPGYPCKTFRIEFPDNLTIVCGSFGMIHTKSILTDPILKTKINDAGKVALQKLIKNPSITTFTRASIDFVNETKILEILNLTKTKELMENLNTLPIIGASMNQLGRSVYAVCKKQQEKQVLDVFNSFLPEIKIFSLKINKHGIKIFN